MRLSVDSSNRLFQILAVVFALLAAVVGLGVPVLGVAFAVLAAITGFAAIRTGKLIAERFERTIAALQEQQKDRGFSAAQRAEMVTALSQGERCVVHVLARASEAEANRFAPTVVRLLQDAGRNATFLTSPEEYPAGITIIRSGQPIIPSMPCVATLRTAFTAIGMTPKVMFDPAMPPGRVRMCIGPKP